MKKATKWLFGLFFLSAVIAACNEDVLIDLNGDGIPDSEASYTIPVLQEPITATVYLSGGVQTLEVCLNNPYSLTAGQHINAGTLEVVNDGQYLYVTYNTLGEFANLHLWVGTDLLNVPSVKNGPNAGTPIPGQFPYTFDASGLQHYTFKVPLASSGNLYKCGTKLYFMAHAEVSGDMNGDGTNDGGQTAFGGGTGVNIADPGRWYFYDSYTVQCCTFDVPVSTEIKRVETAYAKPPKSESGNLGYVFVGKSSKTNKSNPESYLGLNLTQNRWGWAVNLKTFGTYTYPVWAAAGLNYTSNGVQVGTATVTYNASGVTVTYNLGTAAVLEEVHVYADDLVLSTIAPGQYGFTKYFDVPYTQNTFTQSFTVADSNSDGAWLVLHAVVGIF